MLALSARFHFMFTLRPVSNGRSPSPKILLWDHGQCRIHLFQLWEASACHPAENVILNRTWCKSFMYCSDTKAVSDSIWFLVCNYFVHFLFEFQSSQTNDADINLSKWRYKIFKNSIRATEKSSQRSGWCPFTVCGGSICLRKMTLHTRGAPNTVIVVLQAQPVRLK